MLQKLVLLISLLVLGFMLAPYIFGDSSFRPKTLKELTDIEQGHVMADMVTLGQSLERLTALQIAKSIPCLEVTITTNTYGGTNWRVNGSSCVHVNDCK